MTITDAAMAVTTYTYGPFGALHTAMAPGGALTRTTRDAFGRVRQLDDPDRGTTLSTHDGFGELVSSTDALGRTVTFSYDALGRTLRASTRTAARASTTTWTWDTAAHGIGKLAQLVSPDGTKSYTYTALAQLYTITLAVNGESDTLQATLGYDTLGPLGTITYPTPAGGALFSVVQNYDAYGHMLTVTDGTTNLPYWHLTARGQCRPLSVGGVRQRRRHDAELFPRQAKSPEHRHHERHDDDAEPRLRLRCAARPHEPHRHAPAAEHHGALPLRPARAADLRVLQHHREPVTAPCALGYGYDPSGNGNLTTKSDVGTFAYGDPAHPHAVTGAGSDSFGYDAVGNQTARPGGATVTLYAVRPAEHDHAGDGDGDAAYDGDQQRIRKTTPNEETLYFGDLYERVTDVAPATTAHRYYVHSPERVVAVVTQGGRQPGTVYVHVDHLGLGRRRSPMRAAPWPRSGATIPSAQRRNPTWGISRRRRRRRPTLGFTGQESDDELGLVNMQGEDLRPEGRDGS